MALLLRAVVTRDIFSMFLMGTKNAGWLSQFSPQLCCFAMNFQNGKLKKTNNKKIHKMAIGWHSTSTRHILHKSRLEKTARVSIMYFYRLNRTYFEKNWSPCHCLQHWVLFRFSHQSQLLKKRLLNTQQNTTNSTIELKNLYIYDVQKWSLLFTFLRDAKQPKTVGSIDISLIFLKSGI